MWHASRKRRCVKSHSFEVFTKHKSTHHREYRPRNTVQHFPLTDAQKYDPFRVVAYRPGYLPRIAGTVGVICIAQLAGCRQPSIWIPGQKCIHEQISASQRRAIVSTKGSLTFFTLGSPAMANTLPRSRLSHGSSLI